MSSYSKQPDNPAIIHLFKVNKETQENAMKHVQSQKQKYQDDVNDVEYISHLVVSTYFI